VTVIDAPSQHSGRLLGDSPPAVANLLTRDGETRLGDTLYATRCSVRFFNCITAFISIPNAIRTDLRQFTRYTALGGLIGGLFGFVISVIYHRNRSMEHQLLRDIRKDKLHVVYQPIVELTSRRIVGAEALVRWTDPDDFAIAPDVFVKLMEERGHVGAITKFVVGHAIRDFAATLRNSPGFCLNVNVAATDLSDPEFLPMLDHAIDGAGILPSSLGIEITESSTARHEVAKETVFQLRQRGHRVFIDDFGTGHSSLAYLHELSVDTVKIDKAFTTAIGTESVTVSILPQILAMAESLRLQVVVEGVETERQASYFQASMQPMLAQGWLFGRPVPPEEFLRLLAEDGETAIDTSTVV
jgi:sensor c-di-GMP phosphodiesterase-like protein